MRPRGGCWRRTASCAKGTCGAISSCGAAASTTTSSPSCATTTKSATRGADYSPPGTPRCRPLGEGAKGTDRGLWVPRPKGARGGARRGLSPQHRSQHLEVGEAGDQLALAGLVEEDGDLGVLALPLELEHHAVAEGRVAHPAAAAQRAAQGGGLAGGLGVRDQAALGRLSPPPPRWPVHRGAIGGRPGRAALAVLTVRIAPAAVL